MNTGLDDDITPSDNAGTLSVKIVTPDVWEAVENLRKVLRFRYGCDYSFSVAANGHVIGCSNMAYGVILPRLATDKI